MTPPAADLHDLTPDQLTANEAATRIVARLTRTDAEEEEPVRIAAFNSYI